MPQQVISDTAVRQRAEEIAQEQTVFREAFRSIDIPERTGDTYGVPVPQDNLAEPVELQNGEEFPYGREDYTEEQIDRQYLGSGSKIPIHDRDDSVFDIVADHVDRHAQKMAEALDAQAFTVLSNAAPSANAVSASDGNSTLEYEDINVGIETLQDREGGYNPDMAFVGPQGRREILDYLADRGTDLGDETVQQGQFANFAGLDFMFSNTGQISGNDAYLVDTDFFGYEGIWNDISTDQEQDFDTRSLKLQIFAEMGWVATQSEAAVRVSP